MQGKTEQQTQTKGTSDKDIVERVRIILGKEWVEMKKKFTIEVEMEERWIDYFMSMLNKMEYLGSLGASRTVSIFSDGDGDFQPKFKSDVEWEKIESDIEDNHYDAG